jgi:hypothetical protein
MNNCPNFHTCSANLCPLDPDLNSRAWLIGEDVCSNRSLRTEPMVKRQKKLNKRQPQSLMEQGLTAEYLIETAPKKRLLTRRQIEVLRENRFKKAPDFNSDAK